MEIATLAGWEKVREGLYKTESDLVLNSLWKNLRDELTSHGVSFTDGVFYWRPGRKAIEVPLANQKASQRHPDAIATVLETDENGNGVAEIRFSEIMEICKRKDITIFSMEVKKNGYKINYKIYAEGKQNKTFKG